MRSIYLRLPLLTSGQYVYLCVVIAVSFIIAYKVEEYVLYRTRLLKIDFSNVRDVVIGGYCLLFRLFGHKAFTVHPPDGVTYSVPRDVSVTDDGQITRGDYLTFPNGREAASAFRADASLSLRYFAVSGTTSGTIAAQKSFLEDHQYAFFSHTQGSYSVRLRDYIGSLVEPPLIKGLEGIPKPFNPSDANAVREYRQFFRDFGSHIIQNVNYGARYPLVRLSCIVVKHPSNMFSQESLGFEPDP